MKLQDQVVSLEIARKLKELGIKNESYFIHIEGKINEKIVDSVIWDNRTVQHFLDHDKNKIIPGGEVNFYPAYTVAELGEILRKFDIENDKHLTVDYYNTYEFYNAVVKSDKAIIDSHYEKSVTEADVRGKVLIYLIENNLVKAEDLK